MKPWEKYSGSSTKKPWERYGEVPTEPEDIKSLPSHSMQRPGPAMEVMHDQTPPPEPMGPVEKYGRKALVGLGAGIGGVAATPESLGLATLPGAMLGGSIGSYVGDAIWGERQPEMTELDYQRTEETLPAAIAKGASNENLKQSVPRFAEGMLTFPYHASKAVAEPLLGGNVEQAAEGGGQLIKGMVAPIGLAGAEAAREAWQKDLPGSMLMAYGGAKGGKVVAGKTGQVVGKGIAQVPGVKPDQMMARHLKQTTKLKPEQRAQNVETALEGEYTGNKRGLDKLYDDIDSVNQEISSVIEEGRVSGKTVSVDAIIERLNDLRKRAMDDPVDYAEILKDIDEIEANFRNHPKAVDGRIPVDIAQRMKIEMYRNLRKQYGEMKGTFIEAKKSLARGIKEELANTIPELAELNKKDSLLLGLERELFRTANRIGNRDLVGIGVPIKYAAMAMHKSKVAMAIGIAMGMLDTPAVQGRLAILLRRAQKRPLLPGELTAYIARLKEKSKADLDEFKANLPEATPEVSERALAPIPGETARQHITPTDPITDPSRMLVNPHQVPGSQAMQVGPDGVPKPPTPAGNADIIGARPAGAVEPTGQPGPRSVGGDYDASAQGRPQLLAPEAVPFQVSPEGTAYRRDMGLPNAPDIGLLEQNPVGISKALRDEVKNNGGGKAGAAKTAAKYGISAGLLTTFLLADDEQKKTMLAAMPAVFFSQARKVMEKAPGEFKATPDVQLQGREAKTIRNPKTGEIIKEIPAQEGKVVPGKSADVVMEEFLRANQVKADEISDLGLKEWAQTKAAKGEPLTKQAIEEYIDNNGWEVKDHIFGETHPQTSGGGKFEAYTEPGGKDYVELFVTAEKPKMTDLPKNYSIEKGVFVGREGFAIRHPDGRSSDFSTTAGGAKKLFLERKAQNWKDGHNDYDSVNNPVVRLRMKSRYMDGKNTLFIEEMQGPTKQNQSKMPETLSKRIYDIGTKRALAYAKEQGHDQIAWTTGDMQVKRYENALRQAVDEVTYDLKTGEFVAKNHDREIMREKNVPPEKLEQYIGGESAKKLIEAKPSSTGWTVYDTEGQPMAQGLSSKKMAEEFAFSNVDTRKMTMVEATEVLEQKRPDLLTKARRIAGAPWYRAFTHKDTVRGGVISKRLREELTTQEYTIIQDIIERRAMEDMKISSENPANRLSGEQITMDKQWPGELYGDFKKGKRIGDEQNELKWSEEDTTLGGWDGAEPGDKVWLPDKELPYVEMSIQYIKDTDTYVVFDGPEQVATAKDFARAKSEATDYIKGYVEYAPEIELEPRFEQGKFNSSATIPAKMKQYGGEEIGTSRINAKDVVFPSDKVIGEKLIDDGWFDLLKEIDPYMEMSPAMMGRKFRDIYDGERIPGLAEHVDDMVQEAVDNLFTTQGKNVPKTDVTSKTPSSFPLYDVTAIGKILTDQVKKEGLKKVALKYGVPAAIITAIMYGKDSKDKAAQRLIKGNPAAFKRLNSGLARR